MLRVAVPNKGSLSEAASAMLSEAGYRQRRDTRELVMVDPDNDIEFFFLRPRDIAVYVGRGTLDVGITGRDLLLDAEVEAEELLPLGFAASTFRFAGPVGDFTKVEELEGKRLATSYDGLLRGYLAERGINAKVVRLDGAVESSVRLGVADAIADVVETGNTLKAAGMEIFGEPILKSEAVLIRRTGQEGAANGTAKEIEVLIRRLQGVLVARQYVLMDYDIRKELVEQAAALTPGLESPTVSPLRDSDWVAVRSMVPKKETNRIMDELYDLGARAILVSSIHACRI
ncbi:ATP phosphoribosyltransferase [Arthrobacter sp. PvP102]|jgi:ATP phosphoribosyltransferase|uniref:ATP phosphoribosyltransferase n=1 Tax=Arthrobacter sp. (strain FB24) TaxID=290399 RepID=HIS1_ARTS2|nr:MULTISPECIES: ATP phosphoribosyltransferase [unclassified Arthrobacter]A0JVK4.1 RecName: Full=ATP phosphoribosyltransferase; Short=ATP-PRT; Short=ATP-PRTase [Arthrobacter sp. FB24]ABK03074.1 ATP phosphoribosyltransferase (homohexameric) [Arthrobacter sp. FB24]MBP1136667.1 ATP phosphoribosyltransferase [Arthrobacter sp. PvP023]MBP1235178.1 ATP phosphoribosyltransferase [Arthrobacter sp. PvP103]MBP1236137.1 ATP phosphoribosyltransferase [Arthrobacter sp. PvP102]